MLTLPIQKGDECIVLFQDFSIDDWWQSGGTGRVQLARRRHDLSDAVALFGVSSVPNAPTNYSTTTAQIRNAAGTQYVEVSNDGVNLVGNVTVNGTPIT